MTASEASSVAYLWIFLNVFLCFTIGTSSHFTPIPRNEKGVCLPTYLLNLNLARMELIVVSEHNIGTVNWGE